MLLHDQIALLKSCGISESDADLQALLSAHSFSLDAAMNAYFESGLPAKAQAQTQAQAQAQAQTQTQAHEQTQVLLAAPMPARAVKRTFAQPASATLTHMATKPLQQLLALGGSSSSISSKRSPPVASAPPVIIVLDESSQEDSQPAPARHGVPRSLPPSAPAPVPADEAGNYSYSNSGQARDGPKLTKAQKHAAQEEAEAARLGSFLVMEAVPKAESTHYFIGRRLVYGYTLSSGYAQREQCLKFQLDTGGYQKKQRFSQFSSVAAKEAATAASSSSKSSSSTNSSVKKIDKHQASQLLFETYQPSDEASGGKRNFRGRLPNLHCEFLVPLLLEDLIVMRAHVSYDLGAVSLMQDVPLSLQIFISQRMLDLTEIGTVENRRYAHLVEPANDLLLWLHEGDDAVAAVRKQRKVDADVRAKAKEAAVESSSANTTAGAGAGADADADGTEPIEVSKEFAELVDTAGATQQTKQATAPEAVQPSLLIPTLRMRPYQLQALHWMLEREKANVDLSEQELMDVDGAVHGAGSVQLTVPHNGLLLSTHNKAAQSALLQESKVGGKSQKSGGAGASDGNGGEDSVWQEVPAIRYDVRERVLPQRTEQRVKEYLALDLRRFAENRNSCAATCSGTEGNASESLTKFYWNMYSQRISRTPPPPHHLASGGILADEMGLGKTVMATSLIVNDYYQEQVQVKVTSVKKNPLNSRHGEKEAREEMDLCDTDSDIGLGETAASDSAEAEACTESDGDSDFEASAASASLQRKHKRMSALEALPLSPMEDAEQGCRRSKRSRSSKVTAASQSVGGQTDTSSGRSGRRSSHHASAANSSSSSSSSSSAPKKKKRKKLSIESDSDGDSDGLPGSAITAPAATATVVTKWKHAAIPRGDEQRGDLAGCVATHATLIVCPMSLIAQWAEEVTSKTSAGALSVIVYYGSNKDGSTTQSASGGGADGASYTIGRDQRALYGADVVITSYGVLQSECRSWLALQEKGTGKENSSASSGTTTPSSSQASLASGMTGKGGFNAFTGGRAKARRPGLLGPFWKRVILDEAHVIKNPRTETALACCTLRSRHRWCLTGTPLQNTIDDAFSLVKFLEHEPWSEYRFWRKVIGEPYKHGDPIGMQRLRLLLGDILLRRTKASKDSAGRPIVELPSRTINIVPVEMQEEERCVCMSLFLSLTRTHTHTHTHTHSHTHTHTY